MPKTVVALTIAETPVSSDVLLIAAAMAMPNMTPSGPGKTVVAGGVANYAGGSAVGVGVTHRARNSRWMVNVAASVTSTGDVGSRVQAGCEF